MVTHHSNVFSIYTKNEQTRSFLSQNHHKLLMMTLLRTIIATIIGGYRFYIT